MNDRPSVIVYADPGETTQGEALNLCENLLAREERESVARFRGAENRHDRVVARSLVRLGLSLFFSISPNEWSFARDAYQRPFVVAPTGLEPFQFSLSHTRGLIALLITPSRCGGVDVEKMERKTDLHLVASKISAASELETLNRLVGEAWKERFFQLWTLKEAYAKARGLGLSLPWEDIAFTIETDGTVAVQFGPGINDSPVDWEFWLNRITPAHMLAVAIRGEGEISFRRVKVRANEKEAWLETSPAAAGI